MSTPDLETENLRLVLQTPDDVRREINSMLPQDRAELSADWLARVRAATSADPWTHGFNLVQLASGAVVGRCGFKGPPTCDGVVEIAYGIAPEHQGKGYATEAAQALVCFAFRDSNVRVVRAHTLPERNASAQVLTKCGFRRVGEFTDPDDGPVWRWEKRIDMA